MTTLKTGYKKIARISKGLFMEARVLAVLVWAFTAVLVGTALAYLETGVFITWHFVLAMIVACLTQAFPTHAMNELTDWASGTDIIGRGGSKVIREGFLSTYEMKLLLWMSLIGIFGLSIIGFLIIDIRLILWLSLGITAGLFYSLKPFKFAYRPFLGEWIAAFVGILVCVTGAYFIQAGTLSMTVIIFATAIALGDMAIMILFHTIDYENDKAATPIKKTTVVLLGQQRAKYYVLFLVGTSIIIDLFLMIFYYDVFFAILIFNLASITWFITYDPFEPYSIIKSTRGITWVVILSGLVFSTIVNIWFGIMSIPVIILYWMHKKFGKITKKQVISSI